jgi:hypothetical protein
MGATFILPDQTEIEISPSWSMDALVRDALVWLATPENARRVRGGALVLAFNSRLEGYVAVQGEIIPLQLMNHLVERGVDLRLAIYPPVVPTH